MQAFREIISITPQDTFLVFERTKNFYDYPLHFHPEYELNFIKNGKGLRRVVGNHMELIDDYELVLVGSHLPHCWEQHHAPKREMYEITIQFPQNLFDDTFLNRRIAKTMKDLFQRAKYGVAFSPETAQKLMPELQKLTGEESLDTHLSFFSLIFNLSISEGQKVLNTPDDSYFKEDKNTRLTQLYNFLNTRYHEKILLSDLAEHLNMSTVSLNRFLKKHTNKTFVDFLNDIRLGFACRWLLEDYLSISEIAFKSGFNNLAHFNRVFKKSKGQTPTEFRNEFSGIKKVL